MNKFYYFKIYNNFFIIFIFVSILLLQMNNRSQNTRSTGSRGRARAGLLTRSISSRSSHGRSSNLGERTSGPINNVSYFIDHMFILPEKQIDILHT